MSFYSQSYSSNERQRSYRGMAIPKEVPKIFIGGLNQTTTKEALREHFEKFGELIDYVLMWDKVRNRSRCFGFVTYKDIQVTEHVLLMQHVIDGKVIDCKKAVPKQETFSDVVNNDPGFITNKIFVGGIPPEIQQSEFKDVFKKYGRIIDCVIIMDKDTRKSRGFGFVEYTHPKSVEKVMQDYYKVTVRDKWVECKKALPKNNYFTEMMVDESGIQEQIPLPISSRAVKIGEWNPAMENSEVSDHLLLDYRQGFIAFQEEGTMIDMNKIKIEDLQSPNKDPAIKQEDDKENINSFELNIMANRIADPRQKEDYEIEAKIEEEEELMPAPRTKGSIKRKLDYDDCRESRMFQLL